MFGGGPGVLEGGGGAADVVGGGLAGSGRVGVQRGEGGYCEGVVVGGGGGSGGCGGGGAGGEGHGDGGMDWGVVGELMLWEKDVGFFKVSVSNCCGTCGHAPNYL